MQVFFLNADPILASQHLADVHVGCGKGEQNRGYAGKQIVESSQMLANAYSLDRLAASDCPKTKKGTPRKHSYLHHPCSKWVLASMANWEWLLNHAAAQVREKIYRGGSEHFCMGFINWAAHNKPSLPDIGFTSPALAMPEKYRTDNFVESYRQYYIYDKIGLGLTWTIRKQPYWW